MSMIKKEYDRAEKKNAIFVACLIDSAIYESMGKISFVDKENIKDYINKFIVEKKFTEANELIRSAKNINSCESITAEVSSKSFRVPFEPYLQLLIISSMNNESLSDSIKRVILPILNSVVDELGKTPEININKLNLIKTHLDYWSKKVSATRDSFYPCFDFFCNKFEDELIKKYIRSILVSESLKNGLDPSMMDMFIEIHSSPTFIKDLYLTLNPSNANLKCSLRADFSYGIDDETGTTATDNFHEEAENTFGSQQADKFYDIVESLFSCDEIHLGDYNPTFSNSELFINGISLDDEKSFNKFIYEKLANEYPYYEELKPKPAGRGNECVEDSVKVSYISLLPSNFAEDIYTKELKNALSNNDYNTALKFSTALETHEVIGKLSKVIYTIFKGATKESKVVTVAIPNTLLSLLDLVRGTESNTKLISDAIESYWKNIKV